MYLFECQTGRTFRRGPQIVLFGPARPAINLLKYLYNGFKNLFVMGGGGKNMKILSSTCIILKSFWILKKLVEN